MTPTLWMKGLLTSITSPELFHQIRVFFNLVGKSGIHPDNDRIRWFNITQDILEDFTYLFRRAAGSTPGKKLES